MPEEMEKGRVRAMFCQLNNMSSKPVRDVKVKGLKYLEKKYDTSIHFYNEHGLHGKNMPKMENFDKWMGDGGRSKIVLAYNRHDEEYEGIHQPGGTAIRVTGVMSQYVRKKHEDFRKLGRFCSVLMWADGFDL